MQSATKRCSICRETKPVSDFYKSAQKADGYAYECKACRSVYMAARQKNNPAVRLRDKERYQRNRERKLAWQKEYTANNRERVQAYRKAYLAANHDRLKAQRRQKAIDDPDYNKARKMREYYRLSLADYYEMRARQENRCAICRDEFDEKKRGPHIDHDHATGAVRGLLCQGCNQAIGCARDDQNILFAAIEYLRAHNTESKRNSG